MCGSGPFQFIMMIIGIIIKNYYQNRMITSSLVSLLLGQPRMIIIWALFFWSLLADCLHSAQQHHQQQHSRQEEDNFDADD